MTMLEINGFDSATIGGAQAESSRRYCEQLEQGQIIYFPKSPFALEPSEQDFLLSQKLLDSQEHKNISYRPIQDALHGYASTRTEEVRELHNVMRRYSKRTTDFLTRFLAPYAPHWQIDFASFRPQEEQGRDLPLKKRNDLLHVDAFPNRPTHGGRILRVFTNINPEKSRVWITTDRFRKLAADYACDAGLENVAADASSFRRSLGRMVKGFKRAVGLRTLDHSPYDEFMLTFHDYLKENEAFQKQCVKTRCEFPPQSSWLVFTDTVPHAVLSGQYALEQTYIIPPTAMVTPHNSPIHILESLCGRSLLNSWRRRVG